MRRVRVMVVTIFPDPEGEPVFELVSISGMHSDVDQLEIICGVLAP